MIGARKCLMSTAILAAALMAAGCTTYVRGTAIATQADESTSVAASSSAAASSSSRHAKVGDAVTLTGLTHGSKITVTVVQVVDKAQGSNEFSTPDSGKRFVSVQFRILNSGSTDYDDSPSNGAKVIDSSGQQFSSDFSTTTAGPELPSDVKLPPGDTALGFITFQLPAGSTVSAVQFGTDSGFGQTGQWSVS